MAHLLTLLLAAVGVSEVAHAQTPSPATWAAALGPPEGP